MPHIMIYNLQLVLYQVNKQAFISLLIQEFLIAVFYHHLSPAISQYAAFTVIDQHYQLACQCHLSMQNTLEYGQNLSATYMEDIIHLVYGPANHVMVHFTHCLDINYICQNLLLFKMSISL